MISIVEIVLPLLGLLSPPLVIWTMIRTGERTARNRGICIPSLYDRITGFLLQAIILLLVYILFRKYLVPGIIPANTLALIFTILGGKYLWFIPGRRILQSQDEALKSQMGDERAGKSIPTVRMASLKPRYIRDFIPDRLIPLPWIIIGLLFLIFLWRFLSTGLTLPQRIGSLGFIILGFGELLLYAVWLRKEVAAPQILEPEDDEEILHSWFELRAFRVRSVFLMHSVLPAFFVLVAIVLLESYRGSMDVMTAAIIGGGGGAFLGVCGGIIGVCADIKRRKHDVLRYSKKITES